MLSVRSVTLATLFAGALVLPATARGESVRYSGVVSAVDPSARTLTIDEIGPWRIEQGQTVVTPRTVHWDSATRFTRYRRMADAPSGYRGDFVEERAEASAVTPGTFVTAECERDGGPPRAARVAIPDLLEP